jgi:hypothetical protein
MSDLVADIRAIRTSLEEEDDGEEAEDDDWR